MAKKEVDSELKAKVLSDMSGTSKFKVVGEDPGYKYYWGSKDEAHPTSYKSMERIGYEIVNSENNSGEEAPAATVKTADGGAIQNADTILMRIPKDYYKMREEKRAEITRERTESFTKEFEDQVERSGGKSRGSSGRSVFVFGSGYGKR